VLRNHSEVPIVVARVEIVEWVRINEQIVSPREGVKVPLEVYIGPSEENTLYFGLADGLILTGESTQVHIVAASITAHPQWARIGWGINREGLGIDLPPGWRFP
jgi:hypothetical protein